MDLFLVSRLTLSGNVKQFDADGVTSITFTCTTGRVTERPEFTWINITDHGDLHIGNKTEIHQHENTSYSQEFTFIPHWYQDKDKIACQIFNRDTNTTTSNVVILSLKCMYKIKSHLII